MSRTTMLPRTWRLFHQLSRRLSTIPHCQIGYRATLGSVQHTDLESMTILSLCPYTKPPTNMSIKCSHGTSPNLSILFAGIFGLFGFHDDKDEEGKVPLSVKRELLKAHRAHMSGDYSTAEDCYHQALQSLVTTEHAQTQVYIEARAVTMDKLANLYLEQRKYPEAEATFKETLRLLLTAGMDQEDQAMIEVSLKMSKIYANQKRYEEAGVGFQWCVDSVKKKVEENRTEDSLALLGICLNSQGKYFHMIGKYKEALEVYSETKAIARELFGANSLNYATLLNDEATATLSLKEPNSSSNAEKLFSESLSIVESLKCPEAVQNRAVTSYNIAILLAERDPTDPKIQKYLRKSISLLEALKDEAMLDDLELYYFKLGTTLINQGNIKDGAAALDKAKSLASQTGNTVLSELVQETLASVVR